MGRVLIHSSYLRREASPVAPSGLLRRRSLVEARAHSLLCPDRPKDGRRARPQCPHDLRRHALVVDGPELPAEHCGRAARPDDMSNVPSKRTEDRAHVRSGARAPGMTPGPHAGHRCMSRPARARQGFEWRGVMHVDKKGGKRRAGRAGFGPGRQPTRAPTARKYFPSCACRRRLHS